LLIMTVFSKSVFWLLVLLLLLFLQNSQLFSLGGANPNLILIGFLILISFGRLNFLPFLAILAAFVLLAFILMPFWFLEILVLAVLATLFNLLKKFSTGNEFADFLITLIIGTILFYIIIYVPNISVLPWRFALKEIFYNAVLGAVIWLGLHLRIDKISRQRL